MARRKRGRRKRSRQADVDYFAELAASGNQRAYALQEILTYGAILGGGFVVAKAGLLGSTFKATADRVSSRVMGSLRGLPSPVKA